MSDQQANARQGLRAAPGSTPPGSRGASQISSRSPTTSLGWAEIALFDVLGLENSVARARVLISGALAAARLLETGELAERIAVLEAALASDRAVAPETVFPEGEP